jgi:hypothetical protein
VAANDLALITNLLNGSPYLHVSSQFSVVSSQ